MCYLIQVDVFKDYFGELEEESIRDNFVIIYELLDETMDFGYPQTMESKILREYITQASLVFVVIKKRFCFFSCYFFHIYIFFLYGLVLFLLLLSCQFLRFRQYHAAFRLVLSSLFCSVFLSFSFLVGGTVDVIGTPPLIYCHIG